MAVLLLSSFDRMNRYISDADGDLLVATTDSDEEQVKREIMQWISQVSASVERFLGRELHIESRTEYFDVRSSKMTYWVKASPISSITSVKEDSSGEFTGSETTLSDYYIGADSESVNLAYSLGYNVRRGLQIVYSGGLAYSGTRSTWTVGDATDFTVGNFVTGSSVDSLGIVKSASDTTLVCDILYGVFSATDTLTEYSDEALSTATGTTDTISAVSQQALVETNPDLVRAAEIQMRHMWKHKSDFILAGTNKDGTNLRRSNTKLTRQDVWPFIEEAMVLLQPYRRPVLMT